MIFMVKKIAYQFVGWGERSEPQQHAGSLFNEPAFYVSVLK
jgi:hypothetical protein